MQSPCALRARLIDRTDLTCESPNEAILLCQVANPKSQMMRQGRQVKLHVNRERFFDGTHGAERFSSPKTSAPKHRQNYFRFCAPANPGPVGHELVISHMIKKMGVVCAVNAVH